MARRSPLNKRYQKDAKVGSTRKSAAAAKPKRSNASGSSGSSSSRSRSGSSSSRRPTARVQLPPEIKRLQKFSFGMLGAAVVLSAIYLWKGRAMGTYGAIMIGLAYALMFGALYIDFARVRPALKAAQRGEAPPAARRAQPSKEAADRKRGAGSATKGDSDSGHSGDD